MIPNLMSKSRVTEVSAATMRIDGAYKKTSLNSDPYLVSMFTALETQSARLNAAINRSKAESELEEKDEVRDTQVRNLYYLIMGLVHHPDPEIETAALQVEKIFDKYGLAITGESYATESALIVSMLDDLSKPKLQLAITLLSGCAEIVAELQATQDDFEEARIIYKSEKAEEGTNENATTFKKEVLQVLIGKVMVYLHAIELVDEPVYGAFTRTVAQIILDNNETVKRQDKKLVEA